MNFPIPIVEELAAQKNRSALLNEHHITGLFYNRFTNFPPHEDYLKQFKKQWIHNQILLEELETISQLLSDHDASVTILKGAHLLLDLYTDLGPRFLSDIDLLIKEEDLARLELILLKLGYQAASESRFHGNDFKREWCKTIGEVEINIELHTRLFFHQKNEFWQTDCIPYLKMTKLKKEDLFIHLCGHLAAQHTFLKLYWLFDIYFYYLKYAEQIDWHALKEKAVDHQLYRSVQMCLWILSTHFGVEVDKPVIDLFEMNKKQWWQNFLTIHFLMYPEEKRSHYFLIKHATKDLLLSALRYDLTWFWHYKVRKLWLK